VSFKVQANVVIKKLYHNGEENIYCWRRCNEEGRWLSVPEQGKLKELKATLLSGERPPGEDQACLLIPGTDVVCQKVTFQKQERKHLARIIPFELEEELTEEIDELHFAFTNIGNEEAVTAYTHFDTLQHDIRALESIGIIVNHCIPEPVLLERLENGWGVRLDDYLHVHYGQGLGFSVERSLASAALASLSHNAQPEHLLLLAEDQDQIEVLRKLLPLELTQHLVEEQIDSKICNAWDSLNFTYLPELELRQGSLAKQLPLVKWWLEWRGVTILAGFALAAFLGLNIAEIQINNAKHRNVLEQINQAYRQVVPQGAVADPERQLKQKLSVFETASGGGSVVAMLAKVAPLVANNDSIHMRNLRYDDLRGTMDVTLTAKTYSDALELSNQIQNTGLGAQLSGVNASGEEQQVRMIITRVNNE